MRTLVENAGGKRNWFSAFREWIETVATFLDEKVRWAITVLFVLTSILGIALVPGFGGTGEGI